MRPSSQEVEEHCLAHLLFRSWCIHCVRGRGESKPHRREERDPEATPEVHIDYCFLGNRDEECQPALRARERDTRVTMSFLAKEKGAANEYGVKRVLAFLK